MRKILLLGGSYSQIPAIIKAKERGFYVITCDYLPHNPGHKFADEYYNVSTTSKEEVLSLAKLLNVDFIFAYASDPAAPVAAYVAQELGLPGNSWESVQLLAEKDKFREFLKQNGFSTPKAITIYLNENYADKISSLTFPLIIKPTDSSGSKGVSKVKSKLDLLEAVNKAFSFSRNKRIIAEEYISCSGRQLHGDGFVFEGNLIFTYLGDHYYNKAINPLVPCATTWPSIKNEEVMLRVENELKRFIKLSGYLNGPINIEIRINEQNDIHILEIGPRSGGHFVPQIIYYATGFDMLDASFDVLENNFTFKKQHKKEYAACYVIHSDQKGKLVGVNLEKKIIPFIVESHFYLRPGDQVEVFQGAHTAIGVLLLLFKTKQEMEEIIKDIGIYVTIKLE